MFGNESPDDAAESHASGKDHLVDAEGAGLDPAGRGELHGEIKGGHGACPAKARAQKYQDDDQRIVDEGENEKRGDEDAGGYGDDEIRGEPAADVRETGGADDGSEAHAAVEDAVTEGSLMEVLGGDDCEQCPYGADEGGEDKNTGEGSLQGRRVLDVAQPGTHGSI